MSLFKDENCIIDENSYLIKNDSNESKSFENNIQDSGDKYVVSNCSGIQDSRDKCIDNNCSGYVPQDKQTDEHESNTESYSVLQPEKKRWYILIVFILMSVIQGFIWNTFGSIAESAQFAFNWHGSMIALIGNWGSFASLVALVPITWTMNEKGIKTCVLVSVGCMFIGGGLKCISSTPHIATWLINIGQILNNLGSPIMLSGPPVVSSLWFPAHQRTTATALMIGLGGSGVSFSYIVGPYVVPGVENKTVCFNSSSINYNLSNCAEQQHMIKEAIMMYMYIEFAIVGVLFLMIILYFPGKPSKAPSITSTLSRSALKKGMIDLMKMPMFWIIAMIYSFGTGVLSGWYTVLDLIFLPLGISQKAAGLIGFWSIVAGQILVLPIGFIADIFAKRMKLILTIVTIIAFISSLVMALTCAEIIPFNTVILYACTIITSACIGCGNPIEYELVSEITYPISEAISNNVMQVFYNVVQLVFVLLFMIPNIGTSWVNWAYMGAIAFCIPLCLVVKEDYKRYDMDTGPESKRRRIPDPIQITV